MSAKTAPVCDDDFWKVLGAWYDAYAPALRAFLMLRLGGDAGAQAEDALHDIFVHIARRAKLETIADPKAYLFRAALHQTRSVRHGQSVRARLLAGAAQAGALRIRPGADPEEAQSVREALENLEPELREVFALHVFADFTFEELGPLLGVSRSALHKRFARAVAQLRRTMGDSKP